MTSTQTPAQWLIERYEDTALQDTRPEDWRQVVIQPLYRLKSIFDAGHPMRVTQDDYRDSGRRWL
jgi:hypothetical protein